MVDSEYLSAEQIATELNVHVQTVQSYFRKGGLPGRKVGRTWKTTRTALDTWLAGTQTELPPLETK